MGAPPLGNPNALMIASDSIYIGGIQSRYGGPTMQQVQAAQDQPLRRVEVPSALVQLIAHWGREKSPLVQSSSDKFDDRELDQRVRESGEW